MGVYNQSNNSLNFELLMFLNGSVHVIFNIKNDIEEIKKTTVVTVSNLICQKPILDVRNRSNDFLNPRTIERSKTFTVVGLTKLNCTISLENIKQWTVHSINLTDASTLKVIDLKNITSASNAEIFIPSNFLDYGTYRFIYQVTMIGDASPFTETVDSFIRIVPTGIAIFPFPGGVKEITVGSGQSIELDPGRYSYDFDELLTGNQLSYKFFCRLTIDGLPQEFPTDSSNNYVDLQSLINGVVPITSNNLCFNYSNAFTQFYSFLNGNTKLTINSSAFEYKEGVSYQFLVKGTTDYGSYEQLVNINVLEYNYIPIANLGLVNFPQTLKFVTIIF
jgi:hypothetical protein